MKTNVLANVGANVRARVLANVNANVRARVLANVNANVAANVRPDPRRKSRQPMRSQITKYRLIPCFAAIAVALSGPVLLAVPAHAGSGPPVVGCTTGSSCMIQLNYYVTYTGSGGGSNGVVVTPPPCIAVPVGDAHVGSQTIISVYGTTAPPPPAPTTAPPTGTASPTGTGTASATPSSSPTPTPTPSTQPSASNLTPVQQTILAKAQQLVTTNPIAPGEWYQLAANPYASATRSAVCANLPPYVWSDSGVLPKIKGLHIPARTLAELAYGQLTTPTLGTLALNPKGTSDTNLPTFVDVVVNPPANAPLFLTTQGHPYVYATAVAPDGTAATVYAVATGLNIDAGTSNATTYDVGQCSVAHQDSKNQDILGSREVANAASYGAGQSIDCGVMYTAPGSYNLTVGIGWTACWAQGTAQAGGPPAKCNTNFPGAAALQDSTTAPVTVNVREIQSVNNG